MKGSFYTARIPVSRVGGCDGHVSVKWKTTDITAISGKDYKGGEGLLEFDNQEISKTIDIELCEIDVSTIFLAHLADNSHEMSNLNFVLLSDIKVKIKDVQISCLNVWKKFYKDLCHF